MAFCGLNAWPILNIEPENRVCAGVALYTVTYYSDNYKVKALLAVPERSNTPLPALLYCRGGMRGVGRVKPERIAQLAAFGYVVLAPHYRGNEGGEGRDEFGGAERQDVHAAYQLLRSSPLVQADRVSLYGFSRGGMMALLAAMDCRDVYSVVVWSGVVDMVLTYEERVDLRRMLRRLIGHPEKNREAYLLRSPIYRVQELSCPVLIIHGREDGNVGVEHAKRLSAELQRHQKTHDIWVVEGASHLFRPAEMEEYTRKMFDWLASL